MASSLRSSSGLASAAVSLVLLIDSEPSSFISMPTSDSRDQVFDAVLPSLITPRSCHCRPMVARSPCSTPPFLAVASYLVWSLMKAASSLKALTKSSIAVLIAAVSSVTLTSTAVALTLPTVIDRPSDTSVKVLLVDSTAMPLIVAWALAAHWFWVIGLVAAWPSKPKADRPVFGLLSSAVSVAVMRKPFSAPVAVERSDRRAPFESLTMVAVTPAPAALILSRIDARLVSPAPMVMLTGELPALASKLVAGGPAGGTVQVPSSSVSVPSLRVLSELVKAPEVVVWLAASCCTVTE